MDDSTKNREYLKSMSAVFTHSTVQLNTWLLPSHIGIYTRDWYVKRNGKTCYIDKKQTVIPVDRSKVRSAKYCNITSTGDNDWHPLISRGTNYWLTKEYKKELIEQYLTSH